MRSLSYVIFTTTLFGIALTSWAGPENGQDLLNSSPTGNVSESANSALTLASPHGVDELLAVPAFADQSNVDSELSSAEHPMIPLPPTAIVGLIMLGGIAVRVIRPQRASRLR